MLNKARIAVPTDPAIWITAAKLEEANGNIDMVEKITTRAIKSLQANGVVISREGWLKEAEASERSVPPMTGTCRAIVKAVVGLGVDDEDRKRTWMADAEECIRRGSIETARAIYGVALAAFPGKASVWRAAAQLEKLHGSREELDALLRRAVTYCPQVSWMSGVVFRLSHCKSLGRAGVGRRYGGLLQQLCVRAWRCYSVWRAAAQLEKLHGSRQELDTLLYGER